MTRTLACAILLFATARVAAMEEADLKDEVTNEFIIHYAIEVPPDIQGRELGLFVCFHGRGGKAPDQARTVLEALGRVGLAKDYVVIGAKASKDGWEESDDFERVTKLIAWATKTYPINPRRRYCWGFSSGGWMSGAFTITHPDLIACAVVHGAGVPENKISAVKDPERLAPDFYGIAGTKDPEHLEPARRGALKLEACGYRSILREVEDLPHSTDCPAQNDDAVRWATSHRHKTLPPTAADLEKLKPLRKPGAAKDAGADPALFADIVAVGGPHAGAVLAPVFDSKDAAVRLAATGACERAMFGVDIIPVLARRVKDKDAGVRAQAIAALGVAANWRYPLAQTALSQIAEDRKWDIAERRLAVAALAGAVHLQVRGRYEDPGMFRSLILAMDDDDAELRASAFAAIKPCIASDYDPAAATRPERKAMLGKWQEWLGQIAAAADKAEVAKGGKKK